jgi:prefoldin subunit 5
MMSRDPDKHFDPAAASVSLAAEAALLEARIHLLQEEIDTVDARIEVVSDALRLLRRTSSAFSQVAENADQ